MRERVIFNLIHRWWKWNLISASQWISQWKQILGTFSQLIHPQCNGIKSQVHLILNHATNFRLSQPVQCVPQCKQMPDSVNANGSIQSQWQRIQPVQCIIPQSKLTSLHQRFCSPLAPNATPKAVFISTKATCFFLDSFHNNKTKVLVKAQEFWWNTRCIKGSVQCSPLTHSPQMLHQRLCSYQQKLHRLLWMRQWIK